MNTSTPTPIRLDQVSKQFGDKTVLHSLDLDIDGGELLTLLGPSGCGKTTALRLIAGFERPTEGRILLGDRDVTGLSVARRKIGVVFQAYSLFPHMSAADNVAYGMKVHRVARTRRRQRSRELLDMVGLAEHADKYPHQMSGGQQQRVALARAIAVEPRVLLLDEPLSALDAKVRVQLREEIRRIQRTSGTTTVMVTHDQEEALTIADRVAVMHAGRIEQLGAPEVVYRSPASAFVAEFVGVVNRLPGVVTDDGVRALGQALALSDRRHRVGEQVEVLVRPEDVAVTIDGAASGVVVAAVLRGAVTSIEVKVPDQERTVRVDLSTGSSVPEVGARVQLRIDPRNVTLDSSGAAPEPAAAAPAGRETVQAQ